MTAVDIKQYWNPTRKMGAFRKDQFVGCLIGQCLGDALGFPVEGYPSEVCENYVNSHLKVKPVKPIGRGKFPFGQYTDDSQLARELFQSYHSCGKTFDPGDYARRIAGVFKEKRIVGKGRGTELAAQRVIQGVPWYEAGTPAPYAGNGSAMRAAPIGLFFENNREKLIQSAHDQGRITHQDPRCSAGAIAIAGAVAFVYGMNDFENDFSGQRLKKFIDFLSEMVLPYDPILADGIEKLSDCISLSPKSAYNIISGAGMEDRESHIPSPTWKGITPFVTESVLWSLYSFLYTPDDYWETICTAITVGGDVDTTAAMAGAISGANNGLDVIPIELIEHLNDRGTWGPGELIGLTENCYTLTPFTMSGLEAQYWHE